MFGVMISCLVALCCALLAPPAEAHGHGGGQVFSVVQPQVHYQVVQPIQQVHYQVVQPVQVQKVQRVVQYVQPVQVQKVQKVQAVQVQKVQVQKVQAVVLQQNHHHRSGGLFSRLLRR